MEVLTMLPTTPHPTRYPYALNVSQMKSLSYLYLVMSFMSVIGSASIVATAIIRKKVLNREVHPIFHLSLADFLGSFFLLIGSIFYIALEENASKSRTCPYLTGLSTAFYMCTFLLTLNYARTVYQRMAVHAKGDSVQRMRQLSVDKPRKKGTQNCKWHYLYYSVAWLLPLITTTIIYSIDHTPFGPNDNICSSCLPLFHFKNSMCQVIRDISYEGEFDWYGVYKYIFVGLLVLSIAGTVAYFMLAYRAFRSIQIYGGIISQRQRDVLKLVKRRLTLFCGTFLFCWTFSLILGIVSMFSSFQMQSLYWLYVLQACTCPLQGFLNAFIYGWKRPRFKQALCERSPLVEQPTSSSQDDA